MVPPPPHTHTHTQFSVRLMFTILPPECSKPLDSALRCFPALKVLYLRQNPLSVCDHHLYTIAKFCPFLLELDLGDCEGLTDAGLAGNPPETVGIASLRRLHSLNLCRLKFHILRSCRLYSSSD